MLTGSNGFFELFQKKMKNEKRGVSGLYKFNICGDASMKNLKNLKIKVNSNMNLRQTHLKSHTEMHHLIKFWQSDTHSFTLILLKSGASDDESSKTRKKNYFSPWVRENLYM